jgi:tmRNA-binding protein
MDLMNMKKKRKLLLMTVKKKLKLKMEVKAQEMTVMSLKMHLIMRKTYYTIIRRFNWKKRS